MFSEKNFVADIEAISIDKIAFECSAPSNIALIKYWGKIEDKPSEMGGKMTQIPANPSVSFTLQHCKTETRVKFERHDGNAVGFSFLFEGKEKESFNGKIATYLSRIMPYCSYLNHYHLFIDTRNTFPHSSGIASSASAMAALSLHIMSLERALQTEMSDTYFYKKASFLARLGSGSACRSIKGKVVTWGASAIEGSSDLWGMELPVEIHENFRNYQDTILLVDKGAKQVSSTVGHNLMHNHPFAERRFEQAQEHILVLTEILQNGDMEAFVEMVELEALTLHAMMMTSKPYFILIKPNTLEIINAIWSYRAETKIPVCFTLDAGANVHVLYPEKNKEAVLQFIKQKLVVYCENGAYICDEIGDGGTCAII